MGEHVHIADPGCHVSGQEKQIPTLDGTELAASQVLERPETRDLVNPTRRRTHMLYVNTINVIYMYWIVLGLHALHSLQTGNWETWFLRDLQIARGSWPLTSLDCIVVFGIFCIAKVEDKGVKKHTSPQSPQILTVSAIMAVGLHRISQRMRKTQRPWQ